MTFIMVRIDPVIPWAPMAECRRGLGHRWWKRLEDLLWGRREGRGTGDTAAGEEQEE